jgi:hypothetical protein
MDVSGVFSSWLTAETKSCCWRVRSIWRTPTRYAIQKQTSSTSASTGLAKITARARTDRQAVDAELGGAGTELRYQENNSGHQALTTRSIEGLGP